MGILLGKTREDAPLQGVVADVLDAGFDFLISDN